MGYILGAILTLTVMGSFWGLSVQLVTFREQGILRRFRLAPMGAGPMLASSILSNYFMALPVVVMEILVCRLAFHMQSWGNLWAIFILVTIGSATFSALGLIVASVTNTMQETQMINNLIWMGFLFLSGATIPLAAFPGWLQRVALFIPAQYLATGLESAGARTGYRLSSARRQCRSRDWDLGGLRSLAPAFPLGTGGEGSAQGQAMGSRGVGPISAVRDLGERHWTAAAPYQSEFPGTQRTAGAFAKCR